MLTEADGVAGTKGWKQPLHLQVTWKNLTWVGTLYAPLESFSEI